jgi:glyoxylase-like metal-dependent hydrolase (beta-lactamase superfamily II)
MKRFLNNACPDSQVVKLHRYTPHLTALELGRGWLGRPLMTVHCYLVGDTLIDCCQTNMAAAMRTFVSSHRIHQLLLTHHHEDHSGNAAMIARLGGVSVMGHRLTADKMQHIRPIMPYQHLLWGQSRAVAVSPLPPLVAAGGFHLLPIHTPGHSKDHTVYLEQQQGWLFSGDLYLGDRIKFFRSDEKIGQQIQSLKRVLQYDFEKLFCAHNPVLENGRERLCRKLAYLEDINGEVQRLSTRGLSARAIIRQLDRRQDRFVKLFTMGNVSFANLIRSAMRAN